MVTLWVQVYTWESYGKVPFLRKFRRPVHLRKQTKVGYEGGRVGGPRRGDFSCGHASEEPGYKVPSFLTVRSRMSEVYWSMTNSQQFGNHCPWLRNRENSSVYWKTRPRTSEKFNSRKKERSPWAVGSLQIYRTISVSNFRKDSDVNYFSGRHIYKTP